MCNADTNITCVCVYTCTVGSAQCSGCVVYSLSSVAAVCVL